ncbi:hypothetical protein Tco_0003364 [Tanacetum coccineum]
MALVSQREDDDLKLWLCIYLLMREDKVIDELILKVIYEDESWKNIKIAFLKDFAGVLWGDLLIMFNPVVRLDFWDTLSNDWMLILLETT